MFKTLSRLRRAESYTQKPFDLHAFHPPLCTELLILQPAPFCNLDCDYCYLPNRDLRARMSLDTIVGFNFDEVEGAYACSSLHGQDAVHTAFLIREFASALRVIAQGLPQYTWRGEPWPENAQTIPFRIITVGWNGDFSTFSPELLGQRSTEFGHFVLGNVVPAGFLQAANTPGFLKMWHLIREGTAACQRTCAYFKYCGGGAPVNKLYENGSFASAETLYCRTMFQHPFDVVLERLERERDEAPA